MVAASSVASAQSLLFRYYDNSTPGVGYSVRGIGDVDGDHVPDLAIGDFRITCGFAGCGPGPSKIAVISGATQDEIWSYAPSPFDGTGYTLEPIGDMDADGAPDLLLGTPYAGGYPWTTGEARIVSGATGAVIRTFPALGTPNAHFGLSVAALGDADGDGVPDIAVSAYDEAFAISGASGALLFTMPAVVPFPVTTTVARYGDYDHDGRADVLFGQVASDANTSGVVRIFSGANGNLLASYSPSNLRPTFGWSLASTGDFDGDGKPDVIVGSPEIDTGSGLVGEGLVELLGSNNGVALRTFAGAQLNEHMGMAVAGGRDFNGDGVPDVAGAAICEASASSCTRHALVWSGATGLPLLDATSTFAGESGVSVDFVGDLDGNTVSEFAFGSPCSLPYSNCGEVRVYSDASVPITTYCTSSTTSSGCSPSISWTGLPSASASSGFTLRADNLEGQKQGLFFYGISGQQAVPWATGSTSFLCVKTPTQRMTVHSSGGNIVQCDGAFAEDWNAYMAAHPAALGSPRAVGESIAAQAWFRDPPAPKTTNLSNALHFDLLP